jgi:hypothetical protein
MICQSYLSTLYSVDTEPTNKHTKITVTYDPIVHCNFAYCHASGVAWLIIMCSGFDDRVFWPLFTITVNYNSSHIEFLLNDLCLTNLSEESLTNLGLISTTPRIRVLCYNRRSVGQSLLDKAHIWGLGPDFYYCQTVAGLLIWDVLSD